MRASRSDAMVGGKSSAAGTRRVTRTLGVAKVLLAAGLIVALLSWLTDWREVLDVFRGARLAWTGPFAISAVVLTWVSCLKWNLFVREQGRVSVARLFSLYWIGMFFNNFLPGSVGGDGIRSYLLGRRIGSQGQALAGVFLERFTGFIAMVTLAVGAVLLNPELRAQPMVLATIVIMGAGCLGVLLVLWKPGILLSRHLPLGRLQPVQRLETRARRFHDHVLAFRGKRALLVHAMILSYGFYLAAALNVYVAGRILGVHLELGPVIAVTPIIMLMASLPLTPGSLGVWEWGFSVFLTTASATTAEGLAISLAIRAQTLITSLIGGVLFLFERSAEQGSSVADKASVRGAGDGMVSAAAGPVDGGGMG